MSYNSITIKGRLTRDPQLKFTASGIANTTLGVAWSERRRDSQTNEWTDGPTTYFNVTCWRSLAENVAESVVKGDSVIVVGKMTSRTYETQEGDKRTTWDINADSVGIDLAAHSASANRVKRESAPESAPAPAASPLDPGDW